jgi:hypothetical protein
MMLMRRMRRKKRKKRKKRKRRRRRERKEIRLKRESWNKKIEFLQLRGVRSRECAAR